MFHNFVHRWTKDGASLDLKDGHFNVFEKDGAYCLAIKGVTPDDAGCYQAEFTNRAGDRKTESTLTVHCKHKNTHQRALLICFSKCLFFSIF